MSGRASYPGRMMEPMTSAAELLATVAARALAEFSGRNAHLGDGSAVHAVTTIRWLGDLEVPGPRCHVGVSGGELAALRPTTAAVTCRRCLRSINPETTTAIGPRQLSLFAA